MKKTKVVAIAGLEVGKMSAKARYVRMQFKAGVNTVCQKIKKIKFRVQYLVKKTLLACFLLAATSITASAQKSVVLDVLSKHGVDAAILNPDNFQQPNDYCFDLRQATVAAGKEKVIEAKFNPASPQDEQWTVIAIDGKSPSKGDINSFRKNQTKPTSSSTDDASYKIEKETSDYLVISSKLDAASIPRESPFMKDCRSYLTINLRTKRAEQMQTLNEKPIKIKILNVEKLDIVTKTRWDEKAKRYLTTNQVVNIQGKFLGQPVPVQTSSEYSNYTQK